MYPQESHSRWPLLLGTRVSGGWAQQHYQSQCTSLATYVVSRMSVRSRLKSLICFTISFWVWISSPRYSRGMLSATISSLLLSSPLRRLLLLLLPSHWRMDSIWGRQPRERALSSTAISVSCSMRSTATCSALVCSYYWRRRRRTVRRGYMSAWSAAQAHGRCLHCLPALTTGVIRYVWNCTAHHSHGRSLRLLLLPLLLCLLCGRRGRRSSRHCLSRLTRWASGVCLQPSYLRSPLLLLPLTWRRSMHCCVDGCWRS